MTLTTETLPWHDRAHHRPGGFQNLEDKRGRPVSLWKGLRWSARRYFHDKDHRPPAPHAPDTLALRRRPQRLRVTWIGHTTVLVQTPGFTLLTDPIFSRRASPVPFAGPSRLIPPALPVRDLPAIDAVLLGELAVLSDATEPLDAIEDLLAALVGAPDNLAPTQLRQGLIDAQIESYLFRIIRVSNAIENHRFLDLRAVVAHLDHIKAQVPEVYTQFGRQAIHTGSILNLQLDELTQQGTRIVQSLGIRTRRGHALAE